MPSSPRAPLSTGCVPCAAGSRAGSGATPIALRSAGPTRSDCCPASSPVGGTGAGDLDRLAGDEVAASAAAQAGGKDVYKPLLPRLPARRAPELLDSGNGPERHDLARGARLLADTLPPDVRAVQSAQSERLPPIQLFSVHAARRARCRAARVLPGRVYGPPSQSLDRSRRHGSAAPVPAGEGDPGQPDAEMDQHGIPGDPDRVHHP